MDHLIELKGAVSDFFVKERFIYSICKKALYKIDKETETIVYQKEIFEKDGLARILITDGNRIFISDFCTLYILNEENFEIVVKMKLGEDLSSDICGMDVGDSKIYCSIRNGKVITVDKSSFVKNEYNISDASMWRLKVYNNCLLCGTVNGQLLLLNRNTMSVEKNLIVGRQDVRSLYVNGTVLYAACQDKKLFKIDLSKFEVIESQKNAHKKMFDCLGLYDDMLVTASYPCSEIALWDMNTLEKRREIKTPLSLSGNAFIEENKLYIISRNIYGVGIIYLN